MTYKHKSTFQTQTILIYITYWILLLFIYVFHMLNCTIYNKLILLGMIFSIYLNNINVFYFFIYFLNLIKVNVCFIYFIIFFILLIFFVSTNSSTNFLIVDLSCMHIGYKLRYQPTSNFKLLNIDVTNQQFWIATLIWHDKLIILNCYFFFMW